MNEDYVNVPDFYAGKSVFITGGAGYLGKVIIEKLLYSCLEINKIYILLRDKKNISAEQRFQDLIELPIFDRIKAKRTNDMKKLILIKGDILSPTLNMNDDDLNTLINKVNIVIHSAASIKFNNPLDVAMSSNYEGTRNLINICHKMKNLHAFAHISTAYTNTDKKISEEKIYPPPATIDEVCEFIKNNKNNEKSLEKFLNGRPNTYVFTKALSETLISETHGNIPTVIVKPSIVSPSIKEPAEGWVDNWFGSSALITYVAKGVIRVIETSDHNLMDLIPVDYVSNLTIVAAARVKKGGDLEVYNACSGHANPLTNKRFSNTFIELSLKDKFYTIPYPNLFVRTQRKWVIYLITLISYVLAYLYDFWMKITFGKPSLVKHLKQGIIIRNALSFFTRNTWIMRTNKTEALFNSLSPEDARLFPFNPRHIDWDEYLLLYFNGIKKYLIKNN